MKIPVHVGVGECNHIFAAVLFVPSESLIALFGFSLSFMRRELDLLHLEFDLAEVVVPLSALFLFFLSTGGSRCLVFSSLCVNRGCRLWLLFMFHRFFL
jgi:hypothetical protein